MHQGIVRGEAGVDGEQLRVTGGAVAERFFEGGIERGYWWIGDDFFHGKPIQ
ncbi:hypothetical protein D3C84_1185490 [compost metagenome]